MFIGPVFTREVVTVPRRIRLYFSRSAYGWALLILIGTLWSVLSGIQDVNSPGDMARFGAVLFQLLAPLQLSVTLVFASLLTASAVAQEKDRRTLILLLLTHLSNCELVLGKLFASLLSVLVMLIAALPVFMLATLFGGISFSQIMHVFVVTIVTAIAAGSLGSTIALWREKTFQTLALTALLLVAWLALGEIVASGLFGDTVAGVDAQTLAIWLSPWQSILEASSPSLESTSGWERLAGPISGYVVVTGCFAVLLNTIAIARVRAWNPSQAIRAQAEEASHAATIWGAEHDLAAERQTAQTSPQSKDRLSEPAAGNPPEQRRSIHAAPGRTRQVWNNPILWREICTWAYGRKVLWIRLGYVLLFAATALALYRIIESPGSPGLASPSLIPVESKPLIPLFVLSLVLLCAQAVTSITNERDGRALDILLVTDLQPKEIIFGKIGGVLYNMKEVLILPALLCVYLRVADRISSENLFYLIVGLLVMDAFAIMLGIHSGMSYSNSRNAIGVSISTLLFLFLGIATCMRMMVAFSDSFQGQITQFFAFMFGGGVGLFLALGYRNPSVAIGFAAFSAPVVTFYAITSFILGLPLGTFLAVVLTYGFATAAMLIPALYEFDVATGRATTAEE